MKRCGFQGGIKFKFSMFLIKFSFKNLNFVQKGAKQVACFKHAFGSLYLSCLGRETDLCDISIKSSAPARRDLKNLQVLPSLGFYASFRNFKIQFCLVSSVGCNFALKKEPPSG